jgi:parvulin-like peptidyl-prolyl isomerase
MLRFLRKKTKSIMIIVAAIFLISMLYGITASRGKWGEGTKKIDAIAKVNGKKLDPYRFNQILSRLAGQFGDKLNLQSMAFVQNLALGQAIDFTLILEQAKKHVKISNREIDMAIENILKNENIKSKDQLKNILKNMGMSMSQFRSMLKDEMLVQKMVNKVKSEAKVTPDDLREIKASHILVSSEAQAEEILAQIKKGGDFSKLAKKYSQDKGTATKGGDLGYFTTGFMVEPFEKKAFSLKVGEISEPVKTRFGYHIIKVTDSRLRKFEGEEKDVEKAALADKQEKAFRRWFSDLKSKAKIEIIDPTLKGHDLRFKGQIAAAVEEYKKAIVANPANPYLHVFLGDAYDALGKKELAISEYEEAVSIEGGNPELYIILAKAYQKAGEKGKAVEQYKRASLVAGDNKAMHQRLLKEYEVLKVRDQVKHEKSEIARIEKKEKFEQELKSDNN